ncbi:hypothetical protein BO71DRAFT_176177 [Aspergillus ellipticus CBS 707.79]|uniref:Uncharacterized protein n=1 Tax=Aspergillus ellipticus CBS 707.79 TaxID=1448320 RepID=A0A319DYA7_9EURO|nr:hypothetical protein BO71DRAFT_176177 [Aspergillus ellipticus CBS 707.79]
MIDQVHEPSWLGVLNQPIIPFATCSKGNRRQRWRFLVRRPSRRWCIPTSPDSGLKGRGREGGNSGIPGGVEATKRRPGKTGTRNHPISPARLAFLTGFRRALPSFLLPRSLTSLSSISSPPSRCCCLVFFFFVLSIHDPSRCSLHNDQSALRSQPGNNCLAC